MTDDQKDALVGKLVLEHGTLLKEIGVSIAEGKRLARVFRNLGDHLDHFPQNVSFSDEAQDARSGGGYVFKVADLDVKRLSELTSDLRAKISRRDEIAGQLKAIGVDAARV